MSILAKPLYQHSRRTPDKLALWCEGEKRTYGELWAAVARWSAALEAAGIARGDHVGVILPNSVDFVVLMMAAAQSGFALVPLPLSLSAASIARAFSVTGTRHLVATADTLRELQPEASGLLAGVTGCWLTVDGTEPGDDFTAIGDLPAARGAGEPVFRGQESDPFILTMTSGSTGDPKPIVLTQRNKFERASAAIQMYGVTESDITLAATPLYHSLAERLVLIPLLTGGTSIVMARFSPEQWLAAVREHAVSFTIAVSSQLKAIADALGSIPPPDCLRCVVSSSALLDTAVKAELLAKLRCDFHECYGASEIAIASNLDAGAARTHLNSVGTAAVGVDIKILRDDGSVAATDEIGEIVCRTPMLFAGYYGRPEMTAAAMWGDYFRTGDLGRLDGEGYLTFAGRKKEIIITGGINVYPADIEAALAGFPGLKEVAAFAAPDDQLGEVVALALVPDGAEIDMRALRRQCARALADFQQPRKFLTLAALPRNQMGKLVRFKLIDAYREVYGGPVDASSAQ